VGWLCGATDVEQVKGSAYTPKDTGPSEFWMNWPGLRCLNPTALVYNSTRDKYHHSYPYVLFEAVFNIH
jgi:hypothetical protein